MLFRLDAKMVFVDCFCSCLNCRLQCLMTLWCYGKVWCHLNFMRRPFVFSFVLNQIDLSGTFALERHLASCFAFLIVWREFCFKLLWIWLEWGHALRFYKTNDLLKCMIYLMRSLSKSTFQCGRGKTRNIESVFFTLTQSE